MFQWFSRKDASRPPERIKPQPTRLVDEAPTGGDFLDEIKYDGYRMHARTDGGQIKFPSAAASTGPIDTGRSTSFRRKADGDTVGRQSPEQSHGAGHSTTP